MIGKLNGKLLFLLYPEHLSATGGTDALGRRLAVLHDYALGILHLPLGTALHTICLHWFTSLPSIKDKL